VQVSRREQVGASEGGQTGSLAEQDSDGVADELAQPSRREMPKVTRLDPLGVIAFGRLA
jgi:hypothetical protein